MPTYAFTDSQRLIGLERASIELANRGEASFKSDLESLWEGVQADRTAMLGQVRELQLATQLLIAAESRRIAADDPEDVRAAALATSSRAMLERIEMLDEELVVATIRVPMVKKTEALLHGRVTDKAGHAAGPVTVTLGDENGKPLAGVPPVSVDTAGYYALVIPAAAAGELAAGRKPTIWIEHGSARIQSSTDVPALAPGGVEVFDMVLSGAELERLKLRSPSSPTAPSGPAKTDDRRPPRAAKKRKST